MIRSVKHFSSNFLNKLFLLGDHTNSKKSTSPTPMLTMQPSVEIHIYAQVWACWSTLAKFVHGSLLSTNPRAASGFL